MKAQRDRASVTHTDRGAMDAGGRAIVELNSPARPLRVGGYCGAALRIAQVFCDCFSELKM